MLSFLSKILALLPLSTVHRIGCALGWVLHVCTPVSAKIQRNNLVQSALCKQQSDFKLTLKTNIGETGKAILETLAIWQKKEADILSLVKQVHGWQQVEETLQQGKGVIFLTPHLGCFEITSIYYGSNFPVTVLYRAPKQAWLLPLMQAGRSRTGVTLAEANAAGVRKLMQALKRGEAIGILPDQIPAEGEGEWADFFGKPAYTMTLASKLAEKTGAVVIMAFGDRLANGAGFDIYFTPLKQGAIATTALLNKEIEIQIAQNPSQYLWRYNRYKQRRHAMEKRSIQP
jgi:Kdo2-lipid IVA lauroyltransferase/acyltransferase